MTGTEAGAATTTAPGSDGLRTCPGCGAPLEGAYRNRKRCVPCAAEATRVGRPAYRAARSEKVKAAEAVKDRGRRVAHAAAYIGQPCRHPTCPRLSAYGRRGFCNAHYKRQRLGQDMDARFRRSSGGGGPRRPIGLKTIDSGGYVRITTASGTFSEHRVVMAQYLGHALLPTDQVHHRNCIRTDNRIENLQLKVGAHGSGGDLFDMIADAERFLALYRPDAQLLLAFAA